MKKTTIALAAALATLSTASFAQSSVTLYGKVDLGLVIDSGNANGKSVRLSSGVGGGSRIGFKGVEDLGAGYKASFQLETGYCADSAAGSPNFCTGNNSFMGRQAHGDLSGPFGLITAGRLYSIDFLNQASADPFSTGFAGDSENLFGDKATARLNNAVQYTTPSVAGFTASGEMALGETVGDWKAGREVGGAATYVKGPLYVNLTLFDQDNANGIGVYRKNLLLGATYDFGVVKVFGQAEKARGNPTGALRPVDSLSVLGGVSVPIAGGTLMASYIHVDDRTALTAPGGGDRDAAQWAAGYVYPLSKRTSLYTAYAHLNNRHGAPYTVGTSTEAGTGNNGFNLGAAHDF
jgi:predicted porin